MLRNSEVFTTHEHLGIKCCFIFRNLLAPASCSGAAGLRDITEVPSIQQQPDNQWLSRGAAFGCDWYDPLAFCSWTQCFGDCLEGPTPSPPIYLYWSVGRTYSFKSLNTQDKPLWPLHTIEDDVLHYIFGCEQPARGPMSVGASWIEFGQGLNKCFNTVW